MQVLSSFKRWLEEYQECTPMHYVTSQWQRGNKSPPYFLYRLVSFVWFIEALTLSFIQVRYTPEYWFVYYTHWSFLMATLQATIALVLVAMNQAEAFNASGGRIQNRVCWVYECSHAAAVTQAFAVTILFWGAVYNPKAGSPNIQTIQVHAVNSVIMMIDLFVVAFPIRFITITVPFFTSLGYLLFNFVYFELGGTRYDGVPYIYSVLDWRNPARTGLFSLLTAVLIIVLFCLTWLLSLARRILHSKTSIRRKAYLSRSSAQTTLQISTIA